MKNYRKFVVLRGLVVVSALSYLFWMYWRVFFWDAIDPDFQLVLRAEGMGAQFKSHEYSYIGWMLISIISYAGIWFGKRWGVVLLAATYALTLALSPFSGVMVTLPVERVAMSIYMLSDGAILGLSVYLWRTLFFASESTRA